MGSDSSPDDRGRFAVNLVSLGARGRGEDVKRGESSAPSTLEACDDRRERDDLRRSVPRRTIHRARRVRLLGSTVPLAVPSGFIDARRQRRARSSPDPTRPRRRAQGGAGVSRSARLTEPARRTRVRANDVAHAPLSRRGGCGRARRAQVGHGTAAVVRCVVWSGHRHDRPGRGVGVESRVDDDPVACRAAAGRSPVRCRGRDRRWSSRGLHRTRAITGPSSTEGLRMDGRGDGGSHSVRARLSASHLQRRGRFRARSARGNPDRLGTRNCRTPTGGRPGGCRVAERDVVAGRRQHRDRSRTDGRRHVSH